MKNRQIKINTALNSCFQDSEVNFKFFIVYLLLSKTFTVVLVMSKVFIYSQVHEISNVSDPHTRANSNLHAFFWVLGANKIKLNQH